jgi:ornithine decarboxylase
MSYGQPIRDDEEVAYAAEVGVETWTVDSVDEIKRMARFAPGAKVLVRLHHDGSGATLPLAAKFGVSPETAVELACTAAAAGLRVIGLAWHVGSQQTDVNQYDLALATAAKVWERMLEEGLTDLKVLNMGGGLPGHYRVKPAPVETYADVITGSVRRHFGEDAPQLWMEPGRGLVADAADLHTWVKAVVPRPNGQTWVFTDALVWSGGLVENMIDEGIEFRISAPDHPHDAPTQQVVLTGPTCDSADTLRTRIPYELPADLKPGDRLVVHSTGAYCATNAALDFNGRGAVATTII